MTIQTSPPRIMVVDDDTASRNLLGRTLESNGYDVSLVPSGEIALSVASEAMPSLILLDIIMPGGIDGLETCRRLKESDDTKEIPVIFITAKDDSRSLVQGFDAGGVDYVAKPFEEVEVLARVRTHLKLSQMTQTLARQNAALQAEIARREQAEAERNQAHTDLQWANEKLSVISTAEAKRWGIEGFIGQSQTMDRILEQVQSLSEYSPTSVLIQGESGTGKELIARAIHARGPRAKEDFIAVNCSVIPDQLAESTLFGHVKGAFTGATQSHRGYFELADGGTLFLDEIGDMPLELQPKLLRVLENQRFVPVGGTREKGVDVCILAATNADLTAQMAKGAFREDLYHRLARFTVNIPPLRERREDIPLLVRHFIEMFGADMGIDSPGLSPQAQEALMAYDYPGNIRELKNIIEGALILSRGETIGREHLHLIQRNNPPSTASDHFALPTEQTQRLIIRGALAQTAGDVDAAAQLLGLPTAHIRQVIDELDAFPSQSPSFVPPRRAARSYTPQNEEERQILAYVRQHGSINNTECRCLLNASRNRASHLLKKLHQHGLLTLEGERRWARYYLPSQL